MCRMLWRDGCVWGRNNKEVLSNDQSFADTDTSLPSASFVPSSASMTMTNGGSSASGGSPPESHMPEMP